ncbi:nuclear transport factor 2 family protein [Pseudomonas gingeri]|uniref:nuclear transport factor 2 family protein n=1 Tax=Pseudomonas gingeri TaxID=117681 RepID=UPI0015A174AD|nr:nuclear transport factor 2 family protein [Pseudomonas gingeri]NVZ24665.1 nuclear transport factor 2 family protein [Pseudomonas gingeri]
MSHTTVSPRGDILDRLKHFLSAWATATPVSMAGTLAPSARLSSSAHGELQGPAAVAKALALDWPHGHIVRIESTNHHVGVEDDRAVLGAYLYGRISPPGTSIAPLLFGALLVGELAATDGGWLFSQLQLTLNWLDGNHALVPRWNPPRSRRFWEVGDPAPHLLNELDSPWARLPFARVAGTAQDEVAEVFMRYIWAMDQADFGQMRDTLAHDIAGAFPPIGDLNGRHEVMGQLKNFRQPWPWMQHFCVPLRVDIEGNQAQMLLGRVIAQQPTTPQGLPLYGAHYRIKLRRENQRWRIFWFEYVEGWITTPSSI